MKSIAQQLGELAKKFPELRCRYSDPYSYDLRTSYTIDHGYDVHECVFGLLALDVEPVDPRL